MQVYIALSATAVVIILAGVAGIVFAAEPREQQKTLKPVVAAPTLLAIPSADIPAQTPPVVLPTPAPPAAKPTTAAPKQVTPPQYVNDPLSLTMIVNKKFQLRPDFSPGDLRTVHVPRTADEALRTEAATQLEKLFASASAQGVSLTMNSAYRSYATQELLYGRIVAAQGVVAADTQSARPGFSEHQSGLSADVAQASGFSAGAAANWIAAHCHEFGYIVRYPKGKEAITGYQYESWHIRYVGTPLSTTLTQSGLTMEEHFKVGGGGYAN